MAGEIKRQGPHQLATNSTRTGRLELSTRSKNWLSFTSVTPRVITDFLRNEDEEESSPNHIIFRWSKSLSGGGAKQLARRELQVEPVVRTGANGRPEKMVGFETIVSMLNLFSFGERTGERERVESVIVSEGKLRAVCVPTDWNWREEK
ncbi:hypothetical protein RHMOL_Rhmol09G0091000 [Rhododendron molle]|uniref:Uncharacterized protein n=1 Tax=Rhododendron molle TaxID=49168 RepID=A0ACC0MCK9_RHOML|nr:hypothetical protein RHMOL_Rhmol09G0091000 [Rhododendron molle]